MSMRLRAVQAAFGQRVASARSVRGGLVLAVAFALIVAAHMVHPGAGLPVYDGYIPEDPYRYLDPLPGQLGDPTSFSDRLTLDRKGRIPDLIADTSEVPPQAQIYAPHGTFIAPPGATAFLVSITPITPDGPAPKGSHLVGNAYRITFLTDDGRPVPLRPGLEASIVLRGVPGDGPTTIDRFDGASWQQLKSQPAGGTMRFANMATFGDFVLIAKGPAPSQGPSTSPGPSTSTNPERTTAPSPTAAATPVPSLPASPTPAAAGVPTAGPPAEPAPAPGGSPSGGLPIAAGLVAIAAVVVIAAFLVLRRRRRAGREPDWRP